MLCISSGSGDINWKSLITVFSSEMLKFEEEQRQLEEAAQAMAEALDRPRTPPSRRGSGNVESLSSPRGEGATAVPVAWKAKTVFDPSGVVDPSMLWNQGLVVTLHTKAAFLRSFVEINAKLVLFCFFKPAEDRPHQERCLILKFLHTNF